MCVRISTWCVTRAYRWMLNYLLNQFPCFAAKITCASWPHFYCVGKCVPFFISLWLWQTNQPVYLTLTCGENRLWFLLYYIPLYLIDHFVYTHAKEDNALLCMGISNAKKTILWWFCCCQHQYRRYVMDVNDDEVLLANELKIWDGGTIHASDNHSLGSQCSASILPHSGLRHNFTGIF